VVQAGLPGYRIGGGSSLSAGQFWAPRFPDRPRGLQASLRRSWQSFLVAPRLPPITIRADSRLPTAPTAYGSHLGCLPGSRAREHRLRGAVTGSAAIGSPVMAAPGSERDCADQGLYPAAQNQPLNNPKFGTNTSRAHCDDQTASRQLLKGHGPPGTTCRNPAKLMAALMLSAGERHYQ
jgi:hypothetical protein